MSPSPPDGEVVRASGYCCMCDFKFYDEVVLRFRDSAMRGGWGYIELRHLDPAERARLTRAAQPS
jgi:hypothetical protein